MLSLSFLVDDDRSNTDGSPAERRKVPPTSIPNNPKANLQEAYRSTTNSQTNSQQMTTTTMNAEEPDLRFRYVRVRCFNRTGEFFFKS